MEIVKASAVDGSFGPVTEQCVIEYQKNKKFNGDGIVETETCTSIVAN